MDEKELKEVLENHKHWLNEDCDGWGNMRANLNGVDLSEANLNEVDLYGADLRGANLSKATLYRANLYSADLRGANLCKVNFYRADLGGADLSGANLRGANLRGANLRGADLRGVDLSETRLIGVDLSGADLRGAKNVPFIPLACPDTGAFVGFKKAKLYNPDESARQDVIVELEISADARRSSATERKCRCDKAKVLSVTTLEGVEVDADAGTVRSNYNTRFEYRVGEIVTEPNFCEDRWEKCAPGIHFFINRQEAVEYEI